jgi:hypothetical protein
VFEPRSSPQLRFQFLRHLHGLIECRRGLRVDGLLSRILAVDEKVQRPVVSVGGDDVAAAAKAAAVISRGQPTFVPRHYRVTAGETT